MKKITIQFYLLLFAIVYQGIAQTNPVIDFFPPATILHGNIPYNNDARQNTCWIFICLQMQRENCPW